MPVLPNTSEMRRAIVAMADRQLSVWALRIETMRAALMLLRAQFLIRFVAMARWHRSLGQVVDEALAGAGGGTRSDPAVLAMARARARRVERASARLFREPSCLAKAMALQWLMAPTGLGTRLVIAMQHGDRDEEHGWHAWVELGDVMLIGGCDAARYRRALCFAW